MAGRAAHRPLKAAAPGQGSVKAEGIAGMLGRPVHEVAELLRLAQQPTSPDAAVNHEPGETIGVNACARSSTRL
jgi:RNA polymerase nonessential primary-like sigma factor